MEFSYHVQLGQAGLLASSWYEKRDFGEMGRSGGAGCSGPGRVVVARGGGLLHRPAFWMEVRRIVVSYFVRRVGSDKVSYAV